MASIAKLRDFAEGVQVEMRRVTWPDREQLRSATMAVLVFVIILGLMIGAMDWIFRASVRLIVSAFGA